MDYLGDMMKTGMVVFGIVLILGQTAIGAQDRISEDTQTCMDCHASITPGIVEDWKRSRHAVITPMEALSVKGPARKLSGKSVPEEIGNVVVGCAECHTLKPKTHPDTFDHNDYKVHVVVSPPDCATCHSRESEQYDRNLMAHAYDNFVENKVYQLLQNAINGTPEFEADKMVFTPANEATKSESCLYCHGTKLEVTGTEERETDEGEMVFPVIAGWPNQGVGRVNPDGSRGACTACHTRHEFSIEMARKPYTCKECHVGPDVPAFKIYASSKHGNIYSARNKDWNFKNVPWTIGKDFTAPTCATCHISLLVDTEGNVISRRTHEVKNRLPWRIFGLIYAHPHPKKADTTIIRNQEGLPLPTDFAGGSAGEYLNKVQDREKARREMQASCLACHDRSWVEGHWSRFLNTIDQTNRTTLTATKIMGEIWKKGLASSHEKGGNPFDEYVERLWSDVWLFHANTVRFASAMGGGGDYGVFAEGRYQLIQSVRALEEWLRLRQKK